MSTTLETGKRGTGKTLAWVKALPVPCPKLVVHTRAMANYLRRMLRDVRPDIADVPIMVLSRMSDVDRLRSRPFDVDHATWDTSLLDAETKGYLHAMFIACNKRPPLPPLPVVEEYHIEWVDKPVVKP